MIPLRPALCLLTALVPLVVCAGDAALRRLLHDQARTGARVIPYSSAKFDTSDALAILDAAPGDTNAVRLIYSTATLPTSSFGETAGWNREHLWPNSYGLDDAEPSFSDLHNLRACDSNVNSARGNKFFDVSSAADGNLRNPAHADDLRQIYAKPIRAGIEALVEHVKAELAAAPQPEPVTEDAGDFLPKTSAQRRAGRGVVVS